MQNSGKNKPQIIDLTQNSQTGSFCVHLGTLLRKKDKHIFQFVSTRQQEGVTTFAVNAARLLAVSEKSWKILLVDANFQHPQLKAVFDLPDTPGLLHLLSGESAAAEVAHQVRPENLYVIPTGLEAGKLAPELSAEQLSQVLKSLQAHFDCILLDSVPLTASHNAIIAALASDETFLVVQSGRNHVKVMQKAVSLLTRSNCSINTAVLNRIVRPVPKWLYNRLS